MLVYKGVLNNVFKKANFEDKNTGEVKLGKYQLEFLTKKEVNKGEGFQTVLERISIPNELYSKYANEVGEEVEVAVDTMVNKGNVVLYGVAV
jgi:hypothetical protein